ncbi:MAG: IS21 family transposase [Treponema sp.]|nr:IS21 family transposase [Treponema sp.]
MTNYREILRLYGLGIAKARIAETPGCSRQTVVSALRKATEIGLDFSMAKEMSDKELFRRLTPGEKAKTAYKMPDYGHIHKEMAKSGVTLSLLWVEYCEICRAAGEIPCKSTQFNKYYADYVKKTNATKHIVRRPGEIMEVDRAGGTAGVIDTDTGEIIPAYVFVSALPYSGYAYVEAFFSQNQECWIAAHVNAYRFFGGVTRILTPDNLKTGIVSNTKHETAVNRACGEMAEHCGTAAMPARVRRPRDKSTVEDTVGIISTWILAAIRNERFFSLKELNDRIHEKLDDFNRKPFQKKDGSRHTAFRDEKPFLPPLPERHFELASWKTATVQYNYHIACDGQNYSVPVEYIGRKVDVRFTKNTVEVLFDGNRICSHPRLYGRAGQYATQEAHMPAKHRHESEWDGGRFRGWAGKIGANCVAVIESFLRSHRVEQQGYKSCRALLHLADKYSAGRLEAACKRALFHTPRPGLKGVQAILKSGQDKIIDAGVQSENVSRYGFTRGANYFGGGDVEC